MKKFFKGGYKKVAGKNQEAFVRSHLCYDQAKEIHDPRGIKTEIQ